MLQVAAQTIDAQVAPLQLFIQDYSSFAVHLPHSATVRCLFDAVEAKRGVVRQFLRLQYRGKLLEGDNLLSAYGIQSGSIIHSTYQGKGGVGTSSGSVTFGGSGSGGDSDGSTMLSHMSDMEYVRAQCFEDAIAKAIHQVISERPPNAVQRISQILNEMVDTPAPASRAAVVEDGPSNTPLQVRDRQCTTAHVDMTEVDTLVCSQCTPQT